jgi:LEA14-like dessication related protein
MDFRPRGFFMKGTPTMPPVIYTCQRRLFLLLAVVACCFLPVRADEKKEPKGFREPTLKVESVRLTTLSYPKADLIVTVEVENPNAGVTLTDLTYRIKLNDTPSGDGKYVEKISLPAKGKLKLELPVKADLAAIPNFGMNTVMQTRLSEGVKINYTVDTEFDANVLIFKKHIKTTLNGSVPARDLMAKVSPTLPTLRRPDVVLPKIELPF